MKALVTGASSGIGRSISEYLLNYGYDLIVVSKNKEELENIYNNYSNRVKCIELDLSKNSNVFKLYNMTKNDRIDILVNNAGMGDAGYFTETSLDKELEMIRLNVEAYHILTKLFLSVFFFIYYGRILNVASIAGFMPGPKMASYYATKNYIVSLSMAIGYELKKMKSKVKISSIFARRSGSFFSIIFTKYFKCSSVSSGKGGYFVLTIN